MDYVLAARNNFLFRFKAFISMLYQDKQTTEIQLTNGYTHVDCCCRKPKRLLHLRVHDKNFGQMKLKRWCVVWVCVCVCGNSLMAIELFYLCFYHFLLGYLLSWWKQAEPRATAVNRNNKSPANDTKKMK